jgi:septum formation protein
VNAEACGDGAWGAALLGLDRVSLVLASGSPRRAQILDALGIPFERRPAAVDERSRDGETPRQTAVRLAREKASAGARPGGEALVLGADTLVVAGERILGKPGDDDEARGMLRLLSGRDHEVVTGLAVVRERDGAVFTDSETTRVRFRPLAEEEIGILVRSGESGDKAGGYGIQGLAALAVESIEGDYFNVVGLPLGCLRRLVREATA